MSQLRMLFIDDNSSSIYYAKEWAETTFKCDHVGFSDTEINLDRYQPHIVIVDRMQGTPPNATDQETEILDKIWAHRFCPIIIYSAFPDDPVDVANPKRNHPFVKKVQKGSDLTGFQEAVKSLLPHAQVLQEAEQHIRQQYACALRDVAPYAAEVFTVGTADYNEAVKRYGRRRLAALMDEMTLGKLSPWEKYIHPPINRCFQLGDIVRLKAGSNLDPTVFRVVLTPSCDLFFSEGRPPKVNDVLVAHCVSIKEVVTPIVSSSNFRVSDLERWFPSMVLNQGFYQKHVPFPSLRGKIPLMAANLKKLELIPIANIQNNSLYERVASLDSPFRELISWAYMQNACRPGLPDRDHGAWCDEIKRECSV